MFAYLKGILIDATKNSMILEVNGIGYQLSVPPGLDLSDRIPPTGTEMTFYTTLIIRENAHTLCGFLTQDERDLFLLLIETTGVGPKLAMNLIANFSPVELKMLILEENILALSKVSGVGKKIAERLVIELRSKMASFVTKEKTGENPPPTSKIGTGLFIQDATQALLQLGVSQSIAQKAVKEASQKNIESSDLSQLVTDALKLVYRH